MNPDYMKFNRGQSILDRIDPSTVELYKARGLELPTQGRRAGKVSSEAPTTPPALGTLPPTTTDATGKVGYLYSDGKYYSQKPAGVQ